MKNNNINNNNRDGNFKSACRRLLIYQYTKCWECEITEKF